MSVKNKAKDRNDNGKIRRKYTSRTKWAVHWNAAPKAWTNLYMTRPKRRITKHLCNRVVRDMDYDEVAFPLGNHKPHEYYW